MEEVKIRWQKQTNAWLKADGKCQKLIVTSVDDGPLQYFINCEIAFDMWEKLLSIYEQKSEASIHLLQQKFFSYSMEPTDDVSTHISKLVNLGRKLSLAGELVTDNMVMTKMLMTLPNEYNHFYSAWDSISAESKTVNNLTSRLLIEESRIQQNKGEVGGQEKSSALSAKFQNKSSGINGTYGKGKKEFITKNKVNCFYCGKIGHYKRECKSYLRSMNGCKMSTTDTNLNAFVSESRINNTITNTWVLDSGASDHMSANIEWFSSYEPLEDTQQVTIGDGSNLYAIGKELYRVKMTLSIPIDQAIDVMFTRSIATRKPMIITPGSVDAYKYGCVRPIDSQSFSKLPKNVNISIQTNCCYWNKREPV
ncbi:hypothetical protein QTP88_011758 [Uroleucon formosanum]